MLYLFVSMDVLLEHLGPDNHTVVLIAPYSSVCLQVQHICVIQKHVNFGDLLCVELLP